MNLKHNIQDLTTVMTKQYQEASAKLPVSLSCTSPLERLRNQHICQRFLQTMVRKYESLDTVRLRTLSMEERATMKEDVLESLEAFEAKQAVFSRPCMAFFLSQGYLDATEAFKEKVNRYDPDLPPQDFFQALRNVWIMNSLQILFGRKVKTSSSVFGYSMLYPYTDNYLDDPDTSREDKAAFNLRLRERIATGSGAWANDKERRIFDMLRQIEEEHAPEQHPIVRESVLLIQDAQERSLLQQQCGTLSKEDLLWLSFYKGGASVVADACLVKPELSMEELRFAFAYGTFLQLIDDLQDRLEDADQGHQTWFSTRLKKPLDAEVKRLLHFIDQVTLSSAAVSEAGEEVLRVLRECAQLMVFHAVAEQPAHFSEGFLSELEGRSRLPLPYLSTLRQTLEETLRKPKFDALLEML